MLCLSLCLLCTCSDTNYLLKIHLKLPPPLPSLKIDRFASNPALLLCSLLPFMRSIFFYLELLEGRVRLLVIVVSRVPTSGMARGKCPTNTGEDGHASRSRVSLSRDLISYWNSLSTFSCFLYFISFILSPFFWGHSTFCTICSKTHNSGQLR